MIRVILELYRDLCWNIRFSPSLNLKFITINTTQIIYFPPVASYAPSWCTVILQVFRKSADVKKSPGRGWLELKRFLFFRINMFALCHTFFKELNLFGCDNHPVPVITLCSTLIFHSFALFLLCCRPFVLQSITNCP